MGLNDISYSQILQIKRGDKFEFTNLYIKFSSYLMNEKNINFKFFDDMLFKNIFKLEFKKFIEETNFKEIKDIYSYIRESLRSICFNGVKNFIKQDDYVGINEFLLKSKGNKINALENLFKVIEFDLSDEDVSNIIKNNNELVIELDTLLKENNPISDDRPITKLFVSIYSGDRKNITIVADSLEQKRKKEEIEAIRKVSQSDVIKKNKIQAEKLEKKTVDLFKYFDRKYTFKDLEAGIMLLENIDDRTLVYACCGFLLDGKSYKEKTKREFEDFKVRILPLLSEILEKNITIRANHADLLFILEHKYKLKDVISAIDSLPTKYRDNIYLVCGKKLNGISRDVLNQSDVKLFYDKSLVLLREYLTKYIEESLVVEKKEEVQVPKKEEKDGVRDCKKTSNLFEYYDNKYTKEQLMEAVLSFPPELSQLFLKKCGPQLDGIGSVALTPEENRALHNKCAWTTLNRRLEKISKSSQKLVVRRSPNDLVSYLEIYTYDEIKSVVDALDDDRKSIVYKKCGPMLNGEGSFQLTSEETKKFTSILARIKVRLNKKRNPVDGRSKRSSNLSSVNLIKKFENELTVEEIEKIVSMLNDKHQDIIHLVCGEKLDGNTSHIITLEDKKKYRSALNMLVHFSKKIKEDPNYVRKEQKSKNNLLDYFDNKYTYEMIKEVFDTLDEKHQEIIIKKCGLMFDGVGSLKLSREEGDIFTINAFPALKWRLEKKYREVNNIKLKEVVKISGLHRARKSLIDNLKVSCSQERLFEIINNLDEDVKELFYKYYGEQLDSKCAVGINDDELFIVRDTLYTIKKELSQVQVVKRYKYVSLVEAFDNRYTISQINFAIQLLSEEERELLHMRFGPSFTGFITEFGPLKSVSLTAKQVTRINSVILPKLKNNLTKFSVSKDLLRRYNYESVIEAINKLDDEEQKVIYKCYGKNFTYFNLDSLSVEDQKLFNDVAYNKLILQLIQLSSGKVNRDYKFKSLLEYYGNAFTSLQIAEGLKIFSLEEQNLFKKRFGSNFDGEGLVKISKDENQLILYVLIPKLTTELKYLYDDSYKKRKKRFKEKGRIVSKEELMQEQALEKAKLPKITLKVKPRTNVNPSYVPVTNTSNPLVEKIEIVEDKKDVTKVYNVSEKVLVKEVIPVAIIEEKPSIVVDPILEENENDENIIHPSKSILSKESYDEIYKILSVVDFKELLASGFTKEECIVLVLLHRKYNRETFGIEEIASFLETDVDVLKDIARDALEKYKNNVNELIDNYILTLK